MLTAHAGAQDNGQKLCRRERAFPGVHQPLAAADDQLDTHETQVCREFLLEMVFVLGADGRFQAADLA